MRKRIAAALTVMVILSLSGCQGRTEEKSLYSQGLDVVRLMSQMTQSQEYVELAAGSGRIRSMMEEMGDGDYSAPEAVYSILVDENDLGALAGFDESVEMADELRTFLHQRMLSALVTQINAMNGAEPLAAAAACTAQKTFVNHTEDPDLIYLYCFEEGLPAAVTFISGEDETVAANGTFILNDSFSCSSPDEIEKFLENIGVKAEITKIMPKE